MRQAPLILPANFGEDYVAHLYVVRTPRRDELKTALASQGIATGIHYPIPDHLQESVQKSFSDCPLLPVTEQCSREVLTLPCFPELSDHEVETIISGIRRVFERGSC